MLVDTDISHRLHKSLILHRKDFILPLVLVAFLLFFCTKPVHIDDTVFLKSAETLISNPFDPFAARLNWNGKEQSLFYEDNPFLLSYYFAFVMKLFGDAEWVLHIAYMIFPITALLAFAGIAQRSGSDPWIATGLMISAPAFLVSSTTLMGDIPLIAFYLLACYFYLRFLETENNQFGYWMAFAISAALFTKYIGLTLIPLIFVDSIPRGLGRKTIRFLAIPLVLFLLWCLHNALTFGAVHFLEAGESLNLRPDMIFRKVVASFSFAGCGLIAFTTIAVLQSRSRTACWLLLVFTVYLLIISSAFIHQEANSLLMAAGIASVLICFYHATRSQDRLLLLWLGGMLFYSWISEFMAARVALLFGPPLILLLSARIPHKRAIVAIVLNLALSFWMTYEDTRMAKLYREVAGKIPLQNAHYIVHWGAQYYMEKQGLKPFDYEKDRLLKGDLIVVPQTALTSHYPFPQGSGKFRDVEVRLERKELLMWHRGLFMMSRENDGGFYSDHWGMIPFGFGSGRLETIRYFRVVTDPN